MATANKILPKVGFSRNVKDLQNLDDVFLYTGLALLSVFLVAFLARESGPRFPQLNPRGPWEFSDITRLRDFMRNSKEMLTRGRALHGLKPYSLFSDWGDLTMLPPESVDDVRSDRRFDFLLSASDDFHGYIPGFDGFNLGPELPRIISKYLTKVLSKVTRPLSDEAALAIQKAITDDPDWHTVNVQEAMMGIISPMSSRVFMGEELCRDEEWTAAAAAYTFKAFRAATVLQEYPRWMRRYVHWFLPCCSEARESLTQARKCMEPHVVRRGQIKREAQARGEQSPFDDSIEWLLQEGSSRPPADCQIMLSLVAIHTTSDLLSSALIRVAQHPELFQPLREEVIEVLGTQGLKKTAFFELKLMDSVFKETQRLKPIVLAWKRMALENVTLPSGMAVKKGDRIAVEMTHMWDEKYYPDATKFDGYRFLRMRETPGQDHMAHLVSTSRNHLGFGHGVHACPGRFFASNEVKIALCHLLLKYDWKLAGEEGPVAPIARGMSYVVNPESKLMFRRRENEELDLSSLAF